MSNPQFALVPSSYPSARSSFNATNSTIAKVLVDTFAAVAESATTPRYYGGCSVLDIIASSTDASTRDFILWHAAVATTQDAVLTGAIATTAATVVRATGDFVADGWKVGDVVSIYSANNVAPVAGTEGLFGAVSAVSSSTLTFTVIGGAWSVTGAPSGCRICRMTQLFRATVAINAGNTAAIPNVSFMNNAMDASLLRFERKLGLTDMLVLQPVAAVGALPITVSFEAQLARY